MAIVPFAEWTPDLPTLSQGAREALNVVPQEISYAPLRTLTAQTEALPAAAIGAAWFSNDGVATIFAGTATALYLLDDMSWTDVTRTVGGAYATSSDDVWKFAQFGTLALAVNGFDDPQKYEMGTSTDFEALGGSPPVAHYIAVVRDFVVLGCLAGLPMRVQWSGINNAEIWGSILANEADWQDLPDGGNVTGLTGGELGVIFQETAIRRMTYEGAPIVFRIDKIANDLGCTIPGSVAAIDDLAFFLHKSGFYQIKAGQQITPIGRGKIDRTFWAEFNEASSEHCSSMIDQVRGLYVFAYPTRTAPTLNANRLLIYNWRTPRWTRADVTVEIVFSGASQSSLTLDELDPFGTLETLAFSLDSNEWKGVISLAHGAFDAVHRSGTFSGATMEAIIETTEFQPAPGKRATVRSVRPIVDGGSPQCAIGTRASMQETTTYGSAVGMTVAGLAPVYRSGRYFRVRMTMEAGEEWTDAIGLDDIEARPSGRQ